MGVELLYPMHTYLVVSAYEGKVNVMAADWVMPVSYEPFRIGVSLSPKRLTYELIKKSGEFVIAVPSLDLKDRVLRAGSVSGRDEDKSTLFRFGKGKKVSVPIIEECVANIECILRDDINLGDHHLIVGDVVAEDFADFAYDEGARIDRVRFIAHTWGRFTTFADKYY